MTDTAALVERLRALAGRYDGPDLHDEAGTPPSLDDLRADLRGKDLACFCRLDQPCHADVLLEIANSPEAGDATD